MNNFRKHITYTVELPNGVEAEIPFAPCEYHDVVTRQLSDNRFFIGYMVQDDSCENPLEGGDCQGAIYYHQRFSYGSSTSKLHSAEELYEAWQDPKNPLHPFIVPLDAYVHSGMHVSISGEGMQCRWDTSSVCGFWVAEGYAEEEVSRRAAVYAFGKIVEQKLKTKTWYSVHLDRPLKTQPANPVFDNWADAFKCLENLKLKKVTKAQTRLGYERATREFCSGVLEAYNNWLAGDCWGVISLVVDAEGNMIGESDECWGYIGHECAEEEIQSQLDWEIKRQLDSEKTAA